jgi:hypothetical protein
MHSNQNHEPQTAKQSEQAARRQFPENAPSNEPEDFGPFPEAQQLMPENKPEDEPEKKLKKLNVQVYDEGNCVYDEGEPGPFGWKPRSPLDRLPAPIQEHILDLLEDRSYDCVKNILARPKPLGLGFKTSVGALHAFYYRHRTDHLDDTREMLEEQSNYLLAQAGGNDENFVKAAKHLFKRRLLETTLSPVSKTAELRALFGILDRIKSAELAERRLQLAEKKAETEKPSAPTSP